MLILNEQQYLTWFTCVTMNLPTYINPGCDVFQTEEWEGWVGLGDHAKFTRYVYFRHNPLILGEYGTNIFLRAFLVCVVPTL